jgi:hypothetical protein
LILRNISKHIGIFPEMYLAFGVIIHPFSKFPQWLQSHGSLLLSFEISS